VVFTAGAIYATSIFAYVKVRRMKRLTLLATIVVSIQILIGALVVTKKLDVMIVTAHLPIGVALFGITLLVFLRYRKDYLTSVNNGNSGNLD
jgi:heme A synthase